LRTIGYEASFIALAADPLTDWAVTRKVQMRFKQGSLMAFAPKYEPSSDLDPATRTIRSIKISEKTPIYYETRPTHRSFS